MIHEFEQRLADVLGARLPSPFAGKVRAAPSDVATAEAAVTLGVVRAERLPEQLGGAPPRLAPGVTQPRRVVALRCTVDLEVRAAQGAGRTQQLAGVDATLHVLEDPALRRGTALAGGAPDPGFVIHALGAVDGAVPLQPGVAPAGPVRVEAVAEGIFWPVGAPGQAGATIAQLRVRGAIVPIEVALSAPPAAGGPQIDVTVRVDGMGTMQLRAGQAPAALPFGRLAVLLRGPGGQAGAGTLGSGAAGAGGARLVELTDGEAQLTYTPPAAAAHDELVVALEDGADGAGIELGRLSLEVSP